MNKIVKRNFYGDPEECLKYDGMAITYLKQLYARLTPLKQNTGYWNVLIPNGIITLSIGKFFDTIGIKIFPLELGPERTYAIVFWEWKQNTKVAYMVKGAWKICNPEPIPFISWGYCGICQYKEDRLAVSCINSDGEVYCYIEDAPGGTWTKECVTASHPVNCGEAYFTDIAYCPATGKLYICFYMYYETFGFRSVKFFVAHRSKDGVWTIYDRASSAAWLIATYPQYHPLLVCARPHMHVFPSNYPDSDGSTFANNELAAYQVIQDPSADYPVTVWGYPALGFAYQFEGNTYGSSHSFFGATGWVCSQDYRSGGIDVVANASGLITKCCYNQVAVGDHYWGMTATSTIPLYNVAAWSTPSILTEWNNVEVWTNAVSIDEEGQFLSVGKLSGGGNPYGVFKDGVMIDSVAGPSSYGIGLVNNHAAYPLTASWVVKFHDGNSSETIYSLNSSDVDMCLIKEDGRMSQ